MAGALEATADAAGTAVQGVPSVPALPSVESSPPAAAAPSPATAQQAATGQTANSSATATQQQPSNVVISTRQDSAGDGVPIVQANLGSATSGSSNDSTTHQAAAPAGNTPDGNAPSAGGQSSNQQGSTNQNAGSSATSTQNQPQNIVIIVRINSPGDDTIEQVNASIAISNAGNTSGTQQGSGGSTASGAPEQGPSKDTPVPVGPPAQQQQSAPAGASAAPAPAAPAALQATPPKLALLPRSNAAHRPTAAGKQRAAKSPSQPGRTNGGQAKSDEAPVAPAAASSSQPVTISQPATTAPVLSTTLAAAATGGESSEPRAKPARVAGPAVRGKAKPHKQRATPEHSGPARRAVDFLGKLAQPRVRPSEKGKEVSNAVVFTLIAILGALLVFVLTTHLSTATRLLDPRNWRH